MGKRALSAAALIPLALFLNHAGGLWFLGALLALNLLALREFCALATACGRRVSRVTLPAVATALLVFLPASGGAPHLLPLAFLALACGILLPRGIESADDRLAWSTLALVWITLPLSTLALLRALPRGADTVLLLLVCVWAFDSFAYLGGVAFGRVRLAPSLSPKKSVEGFLFGVAGALVAAHLLNGALALMPAAQALLLAALVALFGQVGDLVESALKRRGDLKDSGALIPGHGGLLDRIDGLLFAAPAVYALLVAAGAF